jgi:hypothetical protein
LEFFGIDKDWWFFQELNEPARPAAARPVSHDMGGLAAGGSVRQHSCCTLCSYLSPNVNSNFNFLAATLY